MEKKNSLGIPSCPHQCEREQEFLRRTLELVNTNERLRREIEKRKRTEAILRLSEKKYSLVVNNSLVGIHISQEGRIVFVNDRFAKIFGYSKDELLGMKIQNLIHPEDRDMIMEFMLRRIQGRQVPQEYEIRGITKDGGIIWLLRNSTVIDYQGKPAILGNTIDITKRKIAEAALRESEKQLHILSKRLLNAQEKERERIAHELHDGVGQFLTAIKFRLENACSQIALKYPQVDLGLFKDIIPVIQQALEEVRRISMDLRPSMLDDLGLIATLQWFVREFQKANPAIHVEKKILLRESEVPESLKTVIYRIVQEAFHNVSKHSYATELYLALLLCNRKTIILQIKDNGRGFWVDRTLSHAEWEKGLGLASMKKRTELSGGCFNIDSFPMQGTTLTCRWPLER